jgi:hypothetical protein
MVDAYESLAAELHSTTDATIWARRFIELVELGLDPTDFGWVVGWFANAIETGRTFGREG